MRAVGKRRFFEARLTGGYAYARCCDWNDSDAAGGRKADTVKDWRILEAAGRIQQELGMRPEPRARAMLAAAHLVLGATDEPVRLLERAVRESQRSSALWSDLSAAYLTRAARDGRWDDYPRALESASRSLEIAPTLREALHNRALALEALALTSQALTTWRELLSLERDAGWRAEAEERVRVLGARRKPEFDHLEEELKAALAGDHPEALDVVVRANVGIARDVFELELLPNLARDRLKADRLADAFTRVTGDPYQTALLFDGTDAHASARARRFAEARRLYDRFQRDRARLLFEHVVTEGSATDALSLLARQHLAVIAQTIDMTSAHREVRALLDLAHARRFLMLEGRLHWLLGILQVGDGDPSRAIGSFEEAKRLLLRVNQFDHAAYMDAQIADAFSKMRNSRQAWAARVAILRSVDLIRERPRRLGIFLQADREANESGWPRVAKAILLEARSDAMSPSTGYSVGPFTWEMDWARTQDILEPGKGIQELDRARMALGVIEDPLSKERSELELAMAKAEMATPEAGARATLRTVEDGIHAAEVRKAKHRLPFLLLNRARLFLTSGERERAIADLQQGIVVFERPETSVDDDLLLSSSHRALELYSNLVEALVQSGAPALDSLRVAEQAYQRTFLGRQAQRPNDGLPNLEGLEPGTAVVCYFFTPRRLVAWVLTHAELSQHVLAKVPQIDDQARDLVAVRGRADDRDRIVTSLRTALITPLTPRLAGITRLVIVPHLGLYNVPFRALFGEACPTLSVAPSVRFALSGGSWNGVKDVLAVASPNPVGVFPALPGARDEAASIQATYSSGLQLGAPEVPRVLAEIARRDVVHFATHAVLDARRPSVSRIVLGGEIESDLTARVIRQLDLTSVALVSLAACSSAETLDDASSHFSLARPFLQAGARAVIGSLAAVDDWSARSVFARLHVLLASGIRPSEALQTVQRDPSFSWTRSSLVVYAPVAY